MFRWKVAMWSVHRSLRECGSSPAENRPGRPTVPMFSVESPDGTRRRQKLGSRHPDLLAVWHGMEGITQWTVALEDRPPICTSSIWRLANLISDLQNGISFFGFRPWQSWMAREKALANLSAISLL